MSSNYQIEIEGVSTGNHHKGGYCSDPYDFVDINEEFKFIVEVPNKKFIRDCVDSDGDINLDTLSKYDLYSKIDRKCSGSGYCGCKITNIPRKAKLVKKINIKEMALADYSSDEDLKPTVVSIDNTRKKPRYFSETYKNKCSRIRCKFHPNCKYRYSTDRPCFFNHD